MTVDDITIEETVFAKENITLLEEEIARTLNELSSIKNKINNGEAFSSKSPLYSNRVLERTKKDVCKNLGIKEVSKPRCEYNSAKDQFMAGLAYKLYNCLQHLNLESKTLLQKATLKDYDDAFLGMFGLITLNNKNLQYFSNVFAHEYTHYIQFLADIHNKNFKEGHAREVEISIARKYAEEKNNDFYLFTPLKNKKHYLREAYLLACNQHNEAPKQDFLPPVDTYHYLKSNDTHKRKFGNFYSHPMGAAFFSIMKRREPDDFYAKYVSLRNCTIKDSTYYL